MTSINIKTKRHEDIKNIVAQLNDPKARKRVFVALLARDTFIDYLKSKKISVNNEDRYSDNFLFLSEFDIADFKIDDLRIDVRVIVGDKYPQMWIPRSHCIYNFSPDIYVGIKINKKLNKAEIIGFIESKDIADNQSGNKKYLFINASCLKSISEIEKSLHYLNAKKYLHLSLDHTKAKKLFLAHIDNEISDSDRNFFIRHLATCYDCRNEFYNLYNFDKKLHTIKNKENIFKDFITEEAIEDTALAVEIEENIEIIETSVEQYSEPDSAVKKPGFFKKLKRIFKNKSAKIQKTEKQDITQEKMEESAIDELTIDNLDIIEPKKSLKKYIKSFGSAHKLVLIRKQEEIQETAFEALLDKIDEEDINKEKIILEEIENFSIEEEFDHIILKDLKEDEENLISDSDISINEFSEIQDEKIFKKLAETLKEQNQEENLSEEKPDESQENMINQVKEALHENIEDFLAYLDEIEVIDSSEAVNSLNKQAKNSNSTDDIPVIEEKKISETSDNNPVESPPLSDNPIDNLENTQEFSFDSLEDTKIPFNDLIAEKIPVLTNSSINSPKKVKEKINLKNAVDMDKKIVLIKVAVILTVAGILTCGGLVFFKNNQQKSITYKSEPQKLAVVLPQENQEQKEKIPVKIEGKSKEQEESQKSAEPQKSASNQARNINEVLANALVSQNKEVKISNISWEVGISLANNTIFKNYLMVTGRILKMSLAKNLLLATDNALNTQIKVYLIMDLQGNILQSNIKSSSGSKQIDEIILKTIKETFSYTKLPKIETTKKYIKTYLIISL
ncbi:MAG: DUF1822 family protein [bacterium]